MTARGAAGMLDAHMGDQPPTHRRIWTLDEHGERPLTVNKVADMHRQQWARHTKATRAVWRVLALERPRVPKLDRITVDVYPLHADKRSPQDVGACAPHAKAAVDGLVDAGVIANDTPDIVVRITFHPPIVAGHNGLRLIIRED